MICDIVRVLKPSAFAFASAIQDGHAERHSLELMTTIISEIQESASVQPVSVHPAAVQPVSVQPVPVQPVSAAGQPVSVAKPTIQAVLQEDGHQRASPINIVPEILSASKKTSPINKRKCKKF